MRIAATLALVVITGVVTPIRASLSAQHQHPGVNERGAKVMGFDQEKTVHHFHLYTDGGAIDVAARDPNDKTNLDAIRSHLPHIATMFGQGNFEAPMLVHETNVPEHPRWHAQRAAPVRLHRDAKRRPRWTSRPTTARRCRPCTPSYDSRSAIMRPRFDRGEKGQ
jgi:hypothetical protein